MTTIPICGLSVAEFRELHGFSPHAYESWKKRGLAPRETLFPGTNITRIMPGDYEAWVKRVQRPDVQMAEAQRRKVEGMRRGKLALKSPNHPMNLIRNLQQPPSPPRKKQKPSPQTEAAE
jgi:hypothetical protein